MVELTVTIKGVDNSYKQKFLAYETFEWRDDDPFIKECIETALVNANIEPEDIRIRSLMVVK